MRAPAAGKSARSALIWLILGVLALTGLSPGSAHAQGDASAVAGQTFQIATDSSYPPHVVRAEDNSITGFDIDLMNAIAEDQGFEIEYQALGFAAALQAVSAGQADGVIAAAGITEERKQSFDFSDPDLESQLAIAVRQGEADQFAEWADFAGTTVMAKTGSLSLEHVEEKAAEFGFEVRSLDQSDHMYQEVNLGRADGVMDDFTVLAYGIQQGVGLEMTMDPIPVGELGFAVDKGNNADLLAAFNEGLANLRANGTYDEIHAEYFGTSSGATTGPVTGVNVDESSEVQGMSFSIATDSSYPPHVVRDAENNITGFDIDLMNAIAHNQGFEIEYQALGFAAALQSVTAGQADGVIAAAGITEERQETFDFSNSYLESQLAVAVRQGEAEQFTDWSDFAGGTVMAKTGSLSLDHVEEKAAEFLFEVRSLDQSDPMYQEVNLGRADGVMDDYTVLAYGVNQGNGLELTMDPIPVGELGFAVAKGENEQLLNAFNRGLDNLKADGTYDQLLADYFGEEAAAEQRGFLDLLSSSLPVLLKGLGITLLVTAVAILMASILGLVFGFAKVSGIAVLKWLADAYVNVFRGTPLLVQAFFFYFGLPAATGLDISILWTGILVLSLNAGAYMTEIVRGGIQAVDVGQMEASRSLGLNWMQAMRKVIAPQAIKHATPAAINQFIMTLKDTSILAVLGLAELTYQGQQIIARNFRSFEMWLIVGALYFIVIMLLTQLSNFLDRRFNK